MILKIIKNKINGNNTQAKVARGSLWVGMSGGVEQSARILKIMILTRLLVPDLFGQMAIIVSINSLFEVLTDVGIQKAVIQNEDGDKKSYLSACWFISAIRGILLYFSAFFALPFVMYCYGRQDLTFYMQIAFLTVLLNAFISPKVHRAVRDFKFEKWALVQNGGGLIGTVITILLALWFKCIWVLVFGLIVESLCKVILSYIICPFWPVFKFEKKHKNSILSYARGTLGIPLMYFIYMRTDMLVLERLSGEAALGMYFIASTLARVPLQYIGTVVNQVMLPVLSDLQSYPEKMRNTLKKSTDLILLTGLPVGMGILINSRNILGIMYGGLYESASIAFSILFFSELFRISTLPAATAYLAIGQPHLHRKFNIVRTIVMILVVYPLVKFFGISGAALSGLTAMIISLTVQMIQTKKLVGFGLNSYFKSVWRSLLYSIPVVVCGIITMNITEKPIWRLIINLTVNLLLLVIICYFELFKKEKKKVTERETPIFSHSDKIQDIEVKKL